MGVSMAAAPPAVCAACFGAKIGRRFVDLGAAYDGPAFRDDTGQLVSVDDLVVCEDCVEDAARVLALDVNPAGEVQRSAARAEQLAADWRRYAEGLEAQLAHRPEPKKRPPGRPPVRPEGVRA